MPTDQHFFFTVTKIHRLASKNFGKELSLIGMTHGLAAVLLNLDLIGEGKSQAEVAASMEVEQPTLVQLVSRLKKRKLLEKRRYSGDKRRTAIYLTLTGRELLSEVRTIYQSTYQKLFGHIEKEQLERTERLLQTLYDTSKSLPRKYRPGENSGTRIDGI